MRVLQHLKMLETTLDIIGPPRDTILVKNTRWIRANYSGLLHTKVACGELIEKEQHLATITDPYGKFRHVVKAKNSGYVINVNEASLVYQGDAIFNISVEKSTDGQTEAEEEV